MDSCNWNYDFSSLPHWDNREIFPYTTDTYAESPTQDCLCLIYSIIEARMMDYRGFLAVLKNKSNPELLLNVTRYNIPDQKVAFLSTGHVLIVQAYFINEKSDAYSAPFLILDLQNNRFSLVHSGRNSLSPYTIEEISQNTFVIQPHNIEVRLNTLRYYPMCKINDISRVTLKKFLWTEAKLTPIFQKSPKQKRK